MAAKKFVHLETDHFASSPKQVVNQIVPFSHFGKVTADGKWLLEERSVLRNHVVLFCRKWYISQAKRLGTNTLMNGRSY
jgi:hypothetical protein